MPDFRVNQKIQTPNGPGTIQGVMYDQGTQMILVRHIMDCLTPATPGAYAGECITPNAFESGLWVYDAAKLAAFLEEKEKVKA